MREWIWELREAREFEEDKILEFMATFFAIFYFDDAYLASRGAGFLQHALDILVDLSEQIGLETNTSKTQTMI